MIGMTIGSITNINNLDNMTLNINVWDTSLIIIIEKSILDSNLGVTPQTDGSNILLKFPELTAERRKELVKIISEISEKFKISIRSIRRKYLDEIKNFEKDKSISIDESKRYHDEVQKITDSSISDIENITGLNLPNSNIQNFNKNYQYGSGNDKDFYYFTGISISYIFYRIPCPKDSAPINSIY